MVSSKNINVLFFLFWEEGGGDFTGSFDLSPISMSIFETDKKRNDNLMTMKTGGYIK